MQVHVRRMKTHNILILITFLLAELFCYFLMPSEAKTTYVFYMSVLTITLCFTTLSDLVQEEKQKKILFILGMVVLGSVMAFRAQTGIDDYTYKNYFLRAEGQTLFEYVYNSKLEKGYAISNYILYYLTGGDYNLTQIIFTYLSIAIWGKAVKETKGYASLPVSILLIWTQFYFLIMRAGLVRIFIAAPIVFYALHFIWEKKWKQYILCILVAASFHMSALIMLILLLLLVQKEWFYRHWGYFIGVLIIMMPLAFIFIAKVIAPLLGARYSIYTVIELSISINDLDMLPIWLIGLYEYQRVKDEEERRRYIVAMILVSLSIIFSVFSWIGSLGRLIFYSNLGVVIIIASVCKKKPKNMVDLGIKIMLIVYAMFYLMYTTFLSSNYWDNIFPYVSFWGSL